MFKNEYMEGCNGYLNASRHKGGAVCGTCARRVKDGGVLSPLYHWAFGFCPMWLNKAKPEKEMRGGYRGKKRSRDLAVDELGGVYG